MSSNGNRRDDAVSRAVRFLLYDTSGLGRERLRSKRRRAQSVSARTRSRKRRVTLPRVSLPSRSQAHSPLHPCCRASFRGALAIAFALLHIPCLLDQLLGLPAYLCRERRALVNASAYSR